MLKMQEKIKTEAMILEWADTHSMEETGQKN